MNWILLFLHFTITASDTINTSTAYRTGQYCIGLLCIAFAATAHCPAPRDGLCLSGKVTPDNGETTGAKPTLREKKKKIGTAMKKRSLVHFKSRLPVSDKRGGGQCSGELVMDETGARFENR